MPDLIWKDKERLEVHPADLETVSLVYPRGEGEPQEQPASRVIFGDNLPIMAGLLHELEGKIDLIYADPPFFTNRMFPSRTGRGEDSRQPQTWKLSTGYADQWQDIDSYLNMLYTRLFYMHKLLSPTGSLYLHLDRHASHYARLILDELFGSDRLLNEIIWIYHGPSPIRTAFNRKHDTILVYTKSKDYTFNVDAVRVPYHPNTVKTFSSSPKAGFGKKPNLKRGKVPEDWWYFPVIARLHSERTGYPTQKPEGLLERIILASSNPGDLVADFFCGSGTTSLVASRLNRRFLTADITWRAINVTTARLVTNSSSPFKLENEAGRKVPLRMPAFSSQFSIENEAESIRVQLNQPQDVDSWEIDPRWDGKVFRSLFQAIRTPDRQQVPDELIIPKKGVGKSLCIRIVDLEGVVDQFECPIPGL